MPTKKKDFFFSRVQTRAISKSNNQNQMMVCAHFFKNYFKKMKNRERERERRGGGQTCSSSTIFFLLFLLLLLYEEPRSSDGISCPIMRKRNFASVYKRGKVFKKQKKDIAECVNCCVSHSDCLKKT